MCYYFAYYIILVLQQVPGHDRKCIFEAVNILGVVKSSNKIDHGISTQEDWFFIFGTEQVVKLSNEIDHDIKIQEYWFWTEQVLIAINCLNGKVNPHHLSKSYNKGMMTTRRDKKDAFTDLMVNVLEFHSGNPMEVKMTEFGYDKIDYPATIYKDKVMNLKYSNSSIDTPLPMKSEKKLLYLLWWRDYNLSLKSDKLMSTDVWMKLTQDIYEAF